MISVWEAWDTIEKNTSVEKAVNKPLFKVYGHVLAEDIKAPISMPPFRQSSMDGYAFKHLGLPSYKVVGEIQAGAFPNFYLGDKEATRIFTGARVPDDADTVIMQENVLITKEGISINHQPKVGENVRSIGEQIVEGDIALEKSCFLNEAAIGFLAGLGLKEVKVYKKPKISILITGNELQKPGEPLEEGKVYDSNSVTLQLALKRFGFSKTIVDFIPDDLDSTVDRISWHLKKSDVLIVSGGISVGDYDYVKLALQKNKVKELFYKVNQKPGKPLWFGIKGKKKVFALPGNPASSLTSFYLYVLPALRKMAGFKQNHLERTQARATREISNPFGKTLFLKGMVNNGEALPLQEQASSMLKSFAVCNALLMVPAETQIIRKNDSITCINLEWNG